MIFSENKKKKYLSIHFMNTSTPKPNKKKKQLWTLPIMNAYRNCYISQSNQAMYIFKKGSVEYMLEM